jgi:hypothetical protein
MSSDDEQRIADAMRAWVSKVKYGRRSNQPLQPASGEDTVKNEH